MANYSQSVNPLRNTCVNDAPICIYNQPHSVKGLDVKTTTRCQDAFTLIEVLLVISVISIIGSATYYTVATSQESARERKLEADVASLNSAAQIYLANGGNLPSDLSADEVITKLKTRADAASGAKAIGLKGSSIDSRIQSVWQSPSEAGEDQLRASWNGASRRFVLSREGSSGIKRFELNAALAGEAPATETRENTLAAGTETQWVWDYNENADATASLGNAPTTGTGSGYTPPTGSTKSTLAAPTFSHQGGSVPLIQFNIGVTLTNPNAPGTSQIFYSTGGAYTLYKGGALTAEPNTVISAYAASVDPDHWEDSSIAAKTYNPVPVALSISLNLAQSSLTYQQAGGQMTNQALSTPTPATVNLLSTSQIPSHLLNSSNFQIYYTTDGSDPSSSGTATTGASFSGSFTSPQIDVSLSRWGLASSLAVKAVARSLNTGLFTTSSVVTQTIGISATSLQAPTIDPPSGAKAANLPVSIALTEGALYPADARIYYTLDGTDPGNSNGEPTSGTLYSSQVQPGAGTNGTVVVTARVYGPAGYGKWFTPSSVAVASYSTVTLVDGALVGSANLNGTFVGSLIYSSPSSGGTMNSITFNSGARIISGNLYLPGTPSVRRTNGTVWSTANDSAFSDVIQGWEYNSSQVKTVQTTPRVLNENGSTTPNNYSVTFNNSALLEGKVIRRHDSPAFPTISPPPPKDSNGSTSLNSAPSGPISASQYSSVTLNSAPVGDVRLLPGNYGNLNANNGTAFVLGDPDHPEVTQIYSIQSLNLNSGSDIKIVGKVIITISNGINLSTGSVLGNSVHPEWLQLQFSSGDLNANSGSYVYAQLVNPTGSVTFNAGSIFNGSVTARTLTVNSNGVIFSLPPVIAN